MPNYIKNRLTVTGNEKAVFEFVRSEGSLFDFNRILPMPKELNLEDSSIGEDGMSYLVLKATSSFVAAEDLSRIERKLKERGVFEEAISLGRKYMQNIAQHGHKTWYGWSSEHWGTKWNAIGPSMISGTVVEFDTAWAGVVGIIEKLSTFFPDSVFLYAYADEDTGCNCGRGEIKNGVSKIVFPENGSRDAYELAFTLWPDSAASYSLENGEYVYTEQEE